MNNLILLHGALGSSKQFKKLSLLLNSHFNIHTFDFEGHGEKSSEKDFSMKLFANNLHDFIIENRIEKPQIFGYSMGGYVAYQLTIDQPNLLGDIMSLGTKLKWNQAIAEEEILKLNPKKIEQKVPKFASYLNVLHKDWKKNMLKTAQLMLDLGTGKALKLDDFKKIKNNCFVGLADEDEMVSKDETFEVSEAISESTFYILPNSKHPFTQTDINQLSIQIIKYLKK